MSQGQGGGRPLKFKSVKKLQQAIDAYFAECDPHWVVEEYWDHPYVEPELEDTDPVLLEAQAHGGALKRTRKQPKWRDRDYTQPMELQYRHHITVQIPYTTTGLALALDTSRETLLDYGDGKYDSKVTGDVGDDKFSDTIKRAKLKVQQYAELYLFEGKNAAGAIFNLKNNHAWKDRSEVDETSQITVVTRKHQEADDTPDDEEPDDDDD